MNLKKILCILLAFVLVLSFAACNNEETPSGDSTKKDKNEEESTDMGSTSTVYLAIEDYGIVTIELYEDKAPITVANFKKLVSEGFYDGLTFHRVIESFMIQGGDPLGTGLGGNTDENGNKVTITGEFAANNIDTGIKHVAGTISMARAGHPYEAYHHAGYVNLSQSQLAPYFNSASSQFFIVTETSASNTASLDGKYAAFGQVTEGMDVVRAVAAVSTGEKNKPISPVTIATITFNKAKAEAALAEN